MGKKSNRQKAMLILAGMLWGTSALATTVGLGQVSRLNKLDASNQDSTELVQKEDRLFKDADISLAVSGGSLALSYLVGLGSKKLSNKENKHEDKEMSM